jgi:ABC-type uncharacterized transport system permease subunit
MTQSLLVFLALGLYAAVGLMLWRRFRAAVSDPAGLKTLHALGVVALILHAVILHGTLRLETGFNVALTGAFSAVAWVVAVLFVLTALTKPIENLGIVVMPLTGLTILIEWLWPGEVLLPGGTKYQAIHIVVSILAYSLLCLATIQSLLLLYQEHELRVKRAGGLIRALPPLETMEGLMFQLIGVGFALLTLTLISGVFFSEEMFGRALKLNHHIVLSLIAWVVFAVLLAGRRLYGWRGRTAIHFTLAGFFLLVLGYFGTKFVLEVLLKRPG